jgi:hypothetical protein
MKALSPAAPLHRPEDALCRFASALFAAAGLGPDKADVAARLLVLTDMLGRRTHGLAQCPDKGRPHQSRRISTLRRRHFKIHDIILFENIGAAGLVRKAASLTGEHKGWKPHVLASALKKRGVDYRIDVVPAAPRL